MASASLVGTAQCAVPTGIAAAGRVPNIDLDAEWAQIEQIFNAGIRPSIDRIDRYVAAVSRGSSRTALTKERLDAVRGMLADILRREEENEKLPATEPVLKNLVAALEA